MIVSGAESYLFIMQAVHEDVEIALSLHLQSSGMHVAYDTLYPELGLTKLIV